VSGGNVLSGSVPRVVRRPLGWDLAPADVLRLVRADAHPVALFGTWAGGTDVIGSEPLLVRSPPCSLAEVLNSPGPPGTMGAGGHAGSAVGLAEPTGPAFGGGWIGYLGFGHSGEVLPVPPAPGGPRLLPAWWFGYYDHVLCRDRRAGRWFFEALWSDDREEALERRFDELSRRAHTAPPPQSHRCGDFLLVPSAAEHKAAVGQAVDYIWRGDIFQANICLRLEASFDGDPLDAFCQAATVLRPPYAAFIRMPGGAVASLSPELFLRREDRAVVTRPIKGTHRRSAHRPQAARQRAELERSAKDRAENVMIVDLMRNDLSRVCATGSVQVPRLLAAEPHPGVWHLVSEVHGTLRPSAGDGDLVRAAFPPGSVTGAPKVRALEIIHELEATPREIYTGAVGYRSPVAGLELNVAIRTFEFSAGRVWLGSGGGIVADSVPDAEYAECLLKAGPLIQAIGGHIGAEPATPARFLRPRPAAGVFTSLLVTGGETRGLADHLARLDASARELFGKSLPPALHDSLEATLAQNPAGRLRITVRPAGGPLRALAEVVPLDRPPAQVSLRPAVIEGGLGTHKWLDRRLLADLSAAMALRPGEQLLIEDAGGDVLETDRANVFAVIGGVLHTPPADGRLLPGVARAAVLRAAPLAGLGVSETPISRAQLLAASEVFVTNAVHGARPVRSLAGTPAAWPAGPVASLMAAALTREPPRRDPGAARQPIRVRQAAPPRLRPGGGPIVVLIDNYDSFTFNLAHMLAACDCRVEVVRNDEVTAEQAASFGPAGVVISPGPCTPADAGISVDVVRACGGRVPVLGICLGHQAIAAAFGATIVPAPRPVHGQTSAITHDGRGFLAGLPQPFQATRYHSLMVDRRTLPPVLAVTATAGGRIPMGLRHATQPTEGVQFHPESVLTTCGQTIISNFARALERRALRTCSKVAAGGCGGQADHHNQAASGPGTGTDGAAVRGGDRTDDGQAQARAPAVAGPVGGEPAERLEQRNAPAPGS
jgi:para-aminobenzoate synthetase / 4-amino-4-deoxychorismate lyase